ncbi:MAG: hypothetical protein IIY04_04715 [Oscillospiraceae bacterium]|nr:hypothetical protein [Oscillospiraceae bacterium]
MIDAYIRALAQYAIDKEFLHDDDECYAINRILEVLQLDTLEACDAADASLDEILQALTQDAISRNLLDDNIVARDLFDTKLMGALTPAPHEVRAKFKELYVNCPSDATDWFYRFSQDTNYIRRTRIARDEKWPSESAYGTLEITINRSKPEKDPRAIAAAKLAPQSGYPACQLCAENEGYAGRMNHPARQNHRIIPLTVCDAPWFMQYSPYVYYNEHCIVFNAAHTPMKIERATFGKQCNQQHRQHCPSLFFHNRSSVWGFMRYIIACRRLYVHG